ncbi:MAG: DinB family protein [Flavobacteriales bacterium]|nr:DinB family protein [Flavobacteriales bacterium]
MILYCQSNLKEIKHLLEQINKNSYIQPLTYLSGSSIGQHVRHILEFYQCLIASQKTGIVNYDARLRNLQIEMDVNYSIDVIRQLVNEIDEIDLNQSLNLEGNFAHQDNSQTSISTSFDRELAYCLEHSIHHQALIKVGLKEMEIDHLINQNFGVAPATIRYQKQCAQ